MIAGAILSVDSLIRCILLGVFFRLECCSLTGAKRREWMGLGVAGMTITSDI